MNYIFFLAIVFIVVVVIRRMASSVRVLIDVKYVRCCYCSGKYIYHKYIVNRIMGKFSSDTIYNAQHRKA